ncbi:GPI transamidase component [Thraustotheca clavata]|uniref:GPI transamidase component n=1 Tax=Thraustotheca clavata TaxID=74557 RepID=A0A1V9ZV92_9STRA|nr:GPI transamidase component [Thraustotheca clavata]
MNSIVAIVFFLVCFVHGERVLEEDLLVRPLPKIGKAVAHFKFVHSVDTNSSLGENGLHFDTFPKHIRQLMQKYQVNSFDLVFTNGVWRHKSWGEAFDNGPFGAYLEANVKTQASFQGLAQTLAGIFSASLNKMDASTIKTLLTYQANLPREEFCTENLSPWLKLLPCRTHAGLGAFIHPLNILDSDFISMTVHVSLSNSKLTLVQKLTVVKRLDNNWSLESLLGDSVSSVCPIATKSTITTDLASESNILSIPAASVDRRGKSYLHSLPLSDLTMDALKSPWLSSVAHSHAKSFWDTVSVHRYLTGYGQVRGGIAARISNHDKANPITVSYQEFIPWYLRVYFSSLRITLNGIDLAINEYSLDIIPAKRNGTPAQLRLTLQVPPNSKLDVSYYFEKSFLPLEAHPPDANRGFDIPAAHLSLSKGKSKNTIMYTEPLLIPLPTPDFSMPYNVICLTSTVISMAMGSLVNTLLRHKRKKSNIGNLLDAVKRLFKRKKLTK